MDSNIDLYSPVQTLIAGSANPGSANEQIVYTAQETGTYYVLVWGTENELPNFYTLRLRLATTPTPTPTPTPTSTPTSPATATATLPRLEQCRPSSHSFCFSPPLAGKTKRRPSSTAPFPSALSSQA